MPRLPVRLAAALLGVLLLAPAASARQDAKAQWEALIARNNALAEKADALEKEYETADAARKQALEREFQAVADQFNREVRPQMQKLAGPAFEADPTNVKAGELAVQSAFARNDYPTTEKYAAAILKQDPSNPTALNLLPTSQFAQQKFDEAEKSFAAARKSNVLSPEFQGFALAAPEYKQFWEQERQTRQRQADMNLPRVVFHTNKGDVEFEMFEEEAPNTVANMISLVESGFYDGVKFHRVIPNFMAQGGDPLSKDADPRNDGTGGPGYMIPSEFDAPNARKHFRGSLSMANSGPNTGGSQFFITHLPTTHLNGRHTVYGRVVKGQEIVDGLQIGDVIESAEVLNKRDHVYEPKKIQG